MTSLASAVDPASYVPAEVAKPLEWRGIPAIPVYARWLRIDPSSHEALFQESGHHATWDHVELSFVHGLVPMYQKFTDNVYGDANAMALRGHNVGPMAAHISRVQPANMLLPLHLLSSSCKWPVTARRRLHRGNSICAFSTFFSPYLYCSAKNPNEPEPGPEPSGIGAKVKAKATATAHAMKDAGIGITMLPTGGKTVTTWLGLLDILLGALDVAIDKGIDKVVDKIWMARGLDAKRHITPYTQQTARKLGNAAAGRYMRDTMINKSLKGAAKGFGTTWEIGLPFKLASVNVETGEVKLWTYKSGSWSGHAAPTLAPVELVSDSATPEQTHEPLGPYEPGRTVLDELLEGAPHAW